MWHFTDKGPISSKWSYCQGRVVRGTSKHLRPIPSPTVKNSLRNKHLNPKNKKRKNIKMLRNRNFNIFSQKKTISSLCRAKRPLLTMVPSLAGFLDNLTV